MNHAMSVDAVNRWNVAVIGLTTAQNIVTNAADNKVGVHVVKCLLVTAVFHMEPVCVLNNIII